MQLAHSNNLPHVPYTAHTPLDGQKSKKVLMQSYQRDRDIILISSVRSSSVYQGLIEIHASHFFKDFKFFRF